jgi:argininosuccinate lyase
MLYTMTVKADNMYRAASEGFITASDCADYLVRKGLPFRDAYTVIGRLVQHCIENKKTLETLPLETYKTFSPLFDEDVYGAVRLEECVALRRVPGGPAEEAVRAQMDSIEKFLIERTK